MALYRQLLKPVIVSTISKYIRDKWETASGWGLIAETVFPKPCGNHLRALSLTFEFELVLSPCWWPPMDDLSHVQLWPLLAQMRLQRINQRFILYHASCTPFVGSFGFGPYFIFFLSVSCFFVVYFCDVMFSYATKQFFIIFLYQSKIECPESPNMVTRLDLCTVENHLWPSGRGAKQATKRVFDLPSDAENQSRLLSREICHAGGMLSPSTQRPLANPSPYVLSADCISLIVTHTATASTPPFINCRDS
jgi:hypothetical protein